jgi:DNA-binding transcriptional ArsR family regulator
MAETEWSRLVEGLADELQAALWVRRYHGHMERVRVMSAPSEKLVYLYLIQSQPQSFTTIRRALSLNKVTVDQALRRLLERGHVELDERYLYWVVPPQ